MIRYLIIVISVIPLCAMGKCATEYHQVSGSLFFKNAPLENAKVTIEFIDGLKQSISESTLTDKKGRFSSNLKYNLYSGQGLFSGDKCNFQLDQLQFIIEADNFETVKNQIRVIGRKTVYNKNFN